MVLDVHGAFCILSTQFWWALLLKISHNRSLIQVQSTSNDALTLFYPLRGHDIIYSIVYIHEQTGYDPLRASCESRWMSLFNGPWAWIHVVGEYLGFGYVDFEDSLRQVLRDSEYHRVSFNYELIMMWPIDEWRWRWLVLCFIPVHFCCC